VFARGLRSGNTHARRTLSGTAREYYHFVARARKLFRQRATEKTAPARKNHSPLRHEQTPPPRRSSSSAFTHELIKLRAARQEAVCVEISEWSVAGSLQMASAGGRLSKLRRVQRACVSAEGHSSL